MVDLFDWCVHQAVRRALLASSANRLTEDVLNSELLHHIARVIDEFVHNNRITAKATMYLYGDFVVGRTDVRMCCFIIHNNSALLAYMCHLLQIA